jgi:hypothetical protein
MPLPVSLDLVAQELDSLREEMSAFVNRKTGEMVTVSDEELGLVEESDESELAEWESEMLPQLREIAAGEDWAPLPDKLDIHEWEIMRRFAEEAGSEDLSARLLRAIHGKGAFRMFRATIEDAGLVEEWYQFKHEALKEIAREALEELGVPYK